MDLFDYETPTGELEPLVRKAVGKKVINVSDATFDRLVKAGKLPRYKLGSRISLYRMSDLRALLEDGK